MSGTTADSSTSSADERARASADVAHLRKVAFRTFLAISLSWVLEAGPRALHEFGWMSGAAKDAIGLTAYLVLLGVTLYVMRHVRLGKWLQYGIVCAFVLFAMAQFSDVIDETKWAQGVPLLARTSGVHLWLEYNLVLLGGVMLVGTIYWSLIENEMRRRLLIDRSARLEQSLAERRQQEVELTEARERLEREVEERTKELADRNMRLAVELAERRRFEESLGRRLRYEECLAACSQVLLTGGAHSEALEISLRHLADAAGCDRAYVYSYDDEDFSRSGVLDLRCMHGDDGPPTVFEMCPRTEWKTMSDGHVIRFGPDCDMNEDCAKALTRSGAKSAILVPLGWEGGWRGVLGLEDTAESREWPREEVRVLRMASEIIGASKERERAEIALRNAYDELEQRVEERTRDLTSANAKLSEQIAGRNRAEHDKAQLQKKLRQAQKMQAIGTLAGGIAHDFNNILASIIGYSELALQRAEPDAPGRRYHDEVLKAANRAKELTHQILLFSRQSDHKKSEVLPHLIAKEVLALLEVSCPSNIKIEHNVDSSTRAVLSDTVHMHQVILNLCTNAQHAMKANGGTLRLEIGEIHSDEQLPVIDGELPPGDYVHILVKDNGEGIDPSAVERIFDPFFTTKSVEEGTGMGLAIVHGIVSGAQGGIRVQTALGEGTTFEVFLPVHVGESFGEIERDRVGLRGTERVMVVDDEKQLVGLWREMLDLYGYRVAGFSDSVDALNHFRDNPGDFDLVLLDQTMPGLTGAELARQILAVRPGLPIVMATGFSETVTPELAQEIGISGLVYKPILGDDLAAAVRAAIDEEHLETRASA